MNIFRSAVTVGFVLAAAQANALTFSTSTPLALTYTAPTFTTVDSSTAYEATDSLTNVRLAPVGSSDYLVVTKGGAATVNLSGASSYSFLWGSPDVFNTVSFFTSTGIETFTGSMLAALTGVPSNGKNTNTTFFSAVGDAGQTISSVTFSSTGVAFEVSEAVTAVPEPTAYALMLAGLGAIAFVARRRRS